MSGNYPPASTGNSGNVDLSGYVPVTRTVNEKPLETDIVLDLADFPNVQSSIAEMQKPVKLQILKVGVYSASFICNKTGDRASFIVPANVECVYLEVSSNDISLPSEVVISIFGSDDIYYDISSRVNRSSGDGFIAIPLPTEAKRIEFILQNDMYTYIKVKGCLVRG